MRPPPLAPRNDAPTPGIDPTELERRGAARATPEGREAARAGSPPGGVGPGPAGGHRLRGRIPDRRTPPGGADRGDRPNREPCRNHKRTAGTTMGHPPTIELPADSPTPADRATIRRSRAPGSGSGGCATAPTARRHEAPHRCSPRVRVPNSYIPPHHDTDLAEAAVPQVHCRHRDDPAAGSPVGPLGPGSHARAGPPGLRGRRRLQRARRVRIADRRP